ncbi:MAG: hypothetical protein JSW58_14415 [Candidatus Latescibacterota bacterium]|nr:MAG: hypothetical protein JSW58_14415 [Candidatus Latescibacterota bacterium]
MQRNSCFGLFTRFRCLKCLTTAALLVVVGLSPTVTSAESWQGKEVTRDGVPHVMDPADPIEAPTTITPKELWRISGDEDDEFFFGVL